MKLFPALVLMTWCLPLRAATAPLPMDVNALVTAGAATVSHTTFDIGDAAKVFDFDRDSLARTPSTNPAFVQVAFKEPQTVSGFRVRFSADKHDWKVLAGETPESLAEVAKGTVKSEMPQAVIVDAPVTARVFRLETKRLEGDDYVHILAWELLQPGEASDLTIAGPTGDVLENSVVRLKASVKTADGRLLDVTSDAEWSPGAASARWNEAWTLLCARPGQARVTATYAGLSSTAEWAVKPWPVRTDEFDLDVLYIERRPRMAYDANPGSGGWPIRGQRVEWVAHVRNYGPRDLPSVGYRWLLDGKSVGEGVIRGWKAGGEASAVLPWRWDQRRHTLSFVLDPEAAYAEELTRRNNQVTIATDALAVGFWVEDGLARVMHEDQSKLGDGANSFEDWGQRQMSLWNRMFAEAVHGSSPNGIADRVRLDYVRRVPTDALPLNGGLPTNNPDGSDKTVDLMWGFEYKPEDFGPGKFWEVKHGGPFYYEYGLIHELNHARYLIDDYGFNVHIPATADLLGRDGKPAAGTPAMPYPGGDIVHSSKYRGMMDSSHWFSEHEAYAWNRIAGQRARKGNQNSPDDIGVYLTTDQPKIARLRFVDTQGNPVSHTDVTLHRARPMKDTWYGKRYVNEPDATYRTDADGWITLEKPFGDKVEHAWGHANSVLLFLVKRPDSWRSLFMEATDFNLAWWRGQKDEARFEATLDWAPDTKTPGTVRQLTAGG